MSELVI